MLLIVKKTNNWANLPPLSEVDLAERARDWQDALETEIPLSRLTDAVERARKNHTSAFPINLYEISMAFQELEAEVTARAFERHASDRVIRRVENCPLVKKHLDEFGRILVVNPFNFSEEITLPCRECRPRAFREQRQKFIEKWKKLNKQTASA